MTWSTRELADLAGTTVNTVRHYHSLGLLQAPERGYNGYKHYRVGHLVRLIQVRRLAELGVPLANVEAGAESGVVVSGGLGQIDSQVEAEIERLHRARADIAAILRDRAPAHTPRGFESVASRLSEADRALIQVFSRLYDDESMGGLKRRVAAESDDVRSEFDGLRADSDEVSRQRLARAMGADHPNWRSPCGQRPTGRLRRTGDVRETVAEVLRELYNPAQQDVLRRAADYATETSRPLVTAS